MLKEKRKNELGNLKLEPWKDPGWIQTFQTAGVCAIPPKCLFILAQLLRNCLYIDGDIAEFGVWKGGSARFIATLSKNSGKTIHLFDTFSGMPKTTKKDNFWREGDWHNTSLEEVQKNLFGFPVEFHVGDISETVKNLDAYFCFAHVDCDLYLSVLHSSEYLYPRMSKGGIIVYDDYGYLDCAGAKAAVDEFYLDKKEKPIYFPEGQCIVIKS